MSKRVVAFEISRKEDKLKAVLDTGKGEILKEFEKVCPTDKSFQRIKKDMHDIFDKMAAELQEQ
jgi:hypothetical protein